MPDPTPVTSMRLPADVLALLDKTAPILDDGRGGRAAALCEAVRYWNAAVELARQDVRERFAGPDLDVLRHAVPDARPTLGESGEYVPHWGRRIAAEVHDWHFGRRSPVDGHGAARQVYGKGTVAAVDERVRQLCEQVRLLDFVHGFALMDELRRFWNEE